MIRKSSNIVRSMWIAMVFMLAFTMTALADEGDITRFVKGTDVNGVDIGGMTVEEARTQIENTAISIFNMTVKEKDGKTEVITGAEIGYKVSVPDGLQTILETQNATGRSFGPRVNNSHEMQLTGTYDDAALAARVKLLHAIIGTDIVKTSDAHISAYQEGQPFTIIPEVQGNDVDTEKVITLLRGSAAIGLQEINLADWDCYNVVKTTSEDAQLKALCDRMNESKNMTITHVFGDKTAVLSGDIISTWLTGSENGQIGVSREKAAAYVASLAAQYDTVGTARTFRTADGRDVTIEGALGWQLDQTAETDALIAMIQTGQTQTREPQYAKSAVSRTLPDWGNTYVEIDLTGQHVYMFKDGVQVWDAPCVTGNVSKNYTTPPGLYTLAYKQTDKVLRGKKMPDGSYEYESPVKYWMPFNGGIGLHDADWRSKFGGTIYKNGGSHGCVNLPPAKVKELYDLVYKGIPVICYN